MLVCYHQGRIKKSWGRHQNPPPLQLINRQQNLNFEHFSLFTHFSAIKDRRICPPPRKVVEIQKKYAIIIYISLGLKAVHDTPREAYKPFPCTER